MDCEESWESKNWCFCTVVLEKTLESPLDCKEIQPGHPKDQPWVFFGRNDAKAETPVTLATSCEELTHWKRLWYWEGLGAGGKGDRGWDAGWHHRLDGCKFEWTPGVGDGQGGLECWDSLGHKEWTELNWRLFSKCYFDYMLQILIHFYYNLILRMFNHQYDFFFGERVTSVQFSSVAQSCLTLCDPMNRSTRNV